VTNNRIQKVVIVGGGTAGWITASALSRVLGKEQVSITLIESDQISTIGVGEATIPPIRDFHRMLGLSEADFVRRTQATFKLGIEFSNWGVDGSSYFHPFGEYGRQFDSVAFHHYWMRGKSIDNEPGHNSGHGAGNNVGHLDQYSLCAVAAMAGKFAPNSNDPNSILSAIGYAYHFDASLYAQLLSEYSQALGVRRIEGMVCSVEQQSDSGFIQSVTLESKQVVEGDLFIDCTGFSALLIDKTLGVEFEDWGHYLPCDRALAVQTENTETSILPYTKSIAHAAGWQWRIPLQHRTGNGIVYSSSYMTDEQAKAQLIENIAGEIISEPKSIKFRTGKRRQSWSKNCIAIGLSSGFLEPLESTSIHLIQTAISRLLTLFPGQEFDQADIAEYNNGVNQELDFIRDFIILHYHANQRPESMWKHCREMQIPESLKHKIQLFENRARLFDDRYDLFKSASWLAVMQGQGIQARYYHPIVEGKSSVRVLQLLADMRGAFAQAVAAMPEHEKFILDNCKAAK
jgi:tryptophan halogenase